MAESRYTLTQPGRVIFGLMIFTVAFSIVGGEIEKNQGKPPTVNPFKIILGGTIATSLLILLSHAGEPGEELGTGLATIAFLTAALVYGKPVWDAMSNAFGSKPTGSTGTTTSTTGSSTSTSASSSTSSSSATTST